MGTASLIAQVSQFLLTPFPTPPHNLWILRDVVTREKWHAARIRMSSMDNSKQTGAVPPPLPASLRIALKTPPHPLGFTQEWFTRDPLDSYEGLDTPRPSRMQQLSRPLIWMAAGFGASAFVLLAARMF